MRVVLIAQLSDTHLLGDPVAVLDGHQPARNLVAMLDALPPVDAIVVTGDVANDGSPDSYRLADELTAGRAPRRYVIAGNHDDCGHLASRFGAVDGFRVAALSEHWALALLNSHWDGYEGGCIDRAVVDGMREQLERIGTNVAVCVHHPPLSPCPSPDCGLLGGEHLLEAFRGTRVRVVLSGHLHHGFEQTHDGIEFLGAPSTFCQLRHGGDPHFTDTWEPPGARLVDLRDDGSVSNRTVTLAR